MRSKDDSCLQYTLAADRRGKQTDVLLHTWVFDPQCKLLDIPYGRARLQSVGVRLQSKGSGTEAAALHTAQSRFVSDRCRLCGRLCFESFNVCCGSDRSVVLAVSSHRVGRCVPPCALRLVSTKEIGVDSERAESDAGFRVQGWPAWSDRCVLPKGFLTCFIRDRCASVAIAYDASATADKSMSRRRLHSAVQ